MRDPDRLIAVAGGDGTLRKIALLAAPAAPPIAVLPLGTANNLANSLGIRGALVLTGWHDGALKKFHPRDIEASRGRWGLIEGAGSGALAGETRGKKKQPLLGSPERIAERMPVAASISRDIRVDDERVPGAVIPLEVTAVPLIGPGRYPAPHAGPPHHLVEACCIYPEQRGFFRSLAPSAPRCGSRAADMSRRQPDCDQRTSCIRLDERI